jgi:hypothetical protein
MSRPSQPPVLVFSTDPFAAALIGAAVELAGASPVFPSPVEQPRDALLRLRPAMVFIDCDDDRACAENFLGPVMMTGANVVVFRSRRSRRDVVQLVNRLGVRTISLPEDGGTIHLLVRESVNDAADRRGPS